MGPHIWLEPKRPLIVGHFKYSRMPCFCGHIYSLESVVATSVPHRRQYSNWCGSQRMKMSCFHLKLLRFALPYPFHTLTRSITAVGHNEWHCFHLSCTIQSLQVGPHIWLEPKKPLILADHFQFIKPLFVGHRSHEDFATFVHCHYQVSNSNRCGSQLVALLPPQHTVPSQKNSVAA